MIKLIAFLLCFSLTVQAGLPPSTLSGDASATKPTTFNFKVPNNQATQTGGAGRIETGNKNLLANPSFEHSTIDSSWTITGGGTSASSTTNLQDGAKSLSRTSTGAWTVIQDSTLYAASKSGQDAEASIWVYSATASADLWVCPRVNGASVTASIANGCVQYTNLGLPQKLTVFMLYGSTSTGIEVKGSGAITYILDDAYLGDRRPYVLGITTTPRTLYTPTFTGFGAVTNVECYNSRIGQFTDIDCKFTAGTLTAVEARVSLPTGQTSATYTQGIRKVGDLVGSQTAAAQFTILSESATTYLTFGQQIATQAGLTKQTALAPFANNQIIHFTAHVPIAEFAGDNNAFTTKCDDPRLCETTFSASGSAAGVVSNEDLDWINGNCTVSNTSHYVCPFNAAAGFTVTPNCWVQPETATAGTIIEAWFLDTTNTTSSQVAFDLFENGSRATNKFKVFCRKQGVDYTLAHMTQQIVQMRGVPSVPGATGGIDTFSVSYGATSTTTCTTINTACSYVDSIGSNVTVTHNAVAGSYLMGLPKTYTKLKCAMNAVAATVSNPNPIRCENCSSVTFITNNTSGSGLDTFGTLYCQGSY